MPILAQLLPFSENDGNARLFPNEIYERPQFSAEWTEVVVMGCCKTLAYAERKYKQSCYWCEQVIDHQHRPLEIKEKFSTKRLLYLFTFLASNVAKNMFACTVTVKCILLTYHFSLTVDTLCTNIACFLLYSLL